MRPRAWGLAATGLLHAAALGWLLLAPPQKHPQTPPDRAVSVRLIAAAKPQQRSEVPAAQARPPAAPRPAVLAPHSPAPTAPAPTAATGIAAPAPSPAAAPAEAAPQAAARGIARTEAPAEAQYHAAMPADRQCAAQNVARHYPPMLRDRGIEGQVLLRVRVDEQGRATEIRVQDGSGFRLLDEAAQRLTQGCDFLPARRGEQPLASWVEYPVRFALN